MHQNYSVFSNRTLLWLLFLASFDEPTVWGTNPLVAAAENQSSSIICERRVDDDDSCQNYRCGSYSLASPLYPLMQCAIESAINLTADDVQSLQSENLPNTNPPFFLFAGVSCAFNPNRMNITSTIDFLLGSKTVENMTLDARYLARNLFDCLDSDSLYNQEKIYTNTTMDITEVPPNLTEILGNASERIDDGLEGDKKSGFTLTVPQNIQIRIYAIDDDREFKYRSHPCNIIAPVFGGFNVTFGRWNFINAPGLEFVWNYTAIKETQHGFNWLERLACGEDIDSQDATLELWIPNRILESSTILGPKYDYTLAIEVNGDLEDTPITDNITAANVTANETSPRLLTTRSPQKITVWSDGIGTRVIASINASSVGNDTTSIDDTKLEFFDRTLNGRVEIQTDSHVQGLIQLNGSNTRASMVQSDEAIAAMTIEAIGFRQVLTVSGQYDNITVVDDRSLFLFTTEECSNKNFHFGDDQTCTTVEFNFTGNETIGNGLEPLPPRARLPRTCLMPTKVFEYNCNPLSSGAVLAGPRGTILLIVAASTAAWTLAELLV